MSIAPKDGSKISVFDEHDGFHPNVWWDITKQIWTDGELEIKALSWVKWINEGIEFNHVVPIKTSAAVISFPMTIYKKCQTCDGTGSLRVWDQYATSSGAGWRQTGICPTCNGTTMCTEWKKWQNVSGYAETTIR